MNFGHMRSHCRPHGRLAALAWTATALAAAAVGFTASGALSAPARQLAVKPVATITVTAGKPSEFRFKLSKTKITKPGLVVFKVRNGGKIQHSFKVCSSPKGGTKNTCVGKATKVLAPGKTATLSITLKKGTFEYLCTVPGHAAAGMKGLFGVAVNVPVTTTTPTPVTTTPPPVTTSPTTSTPTNIGAPEGPLIGDPVAGASVFQSAGCGSCHTLAAAGSTGTVGPNLDQVMPDEQTVITNVTYGNAMGMPAFGTSGQLTATQIQNVAAYVETSTNH
jgi:uncharacterized cupredoxin-like copper-binding protein/cytochrome c2